MFSDLTNNYSDIIYIIIIISYIVDVKTSNLLQISVFNPPSRETFLTTSSRERGHF